MTEAYPYGPNKPFQSPEHALVSGMIMGLAAKHGLNLIPVMDEKGYTNRFEIDPAMIDNPQITGSIRIFISVDEPEPRKD